MDDALERLKRGEVRGVIAPQFIASYLVTLHHPTRFHLAVTLPVTPVDLVLSAQTESSQPINIMNKALADMQPRALMQMAGDWRQAALENSEIWNKSTLVNSLLEHIAIAGCGGLLAVDPVFTPCITPRQRLAAEAGRAAEIYAIVN
jgi:two-component system sensor histidine kinase EvgS